MTFDAVSWWLEHGHSIGEMTHADRILPVDLQALADAALASRPEGVAWIPWNGGDCPIMVEYRLRCGKTYTQPVAELDWEHGGKDPAGDILAYRVTPMNGGRT